MRVNVVEIRCGQTFCGNSKFAEIRRRPVSLRRCHSATMAAHASARAFVRIPPKDVGMRLDRWLRSRLPQVTQAHLCRLIRKKLVRLAVKDQAAAGELARAPITLAPSWKHLSTDISSRIEAGMFVSLPAELSASLVCSESRRPESARDADSSHVSRTCHNYSLSGIAHYQCRHVAFRR